MKPRIDQNLGISGELDRWVHSTCVLCSNGYGLDIAVKDERLWVSGDAWITRSTLGTWGLKEKMAGSPTAILQPLEPVSWEEVMDYFIAHFRYAWSRVMRLKNGTEGPAGVPAIILR